MRLTERLKRVMADGNLRVADLARWFNRAYPTVRSWTRGHEMNGPEQDNLLVIERLKLIEKRIRRNRGLPVPRLDATARIAYLNRLMARKRL